MAKVFLIIGLPGSGKTTYASRLAVKHHALRLTPDDWMIPLFDEPAGEGKRDVLEGRLNLTRGAAGTPGNQCGAGFWLLEQG
jgi:predicted kinase